MPSSSATPRDGTSPIAYGWDVVKSAVSDWLDDHAMSFAAALAFYMVLSIAPLLIIAVSVAGLVFGEDAARGQITHQLEGLMGHDGGVAVQSILAHTKKPSSDIAGTVIGSAVLLFGASGVFSELQEAMNVIWHVTSKPGRAVMAVLRDRFFSFAMVLSVGFLALVSLLVSAGLSAAGTFFSSALPGGATLWEIVNLGISFSVTTLLFGLIFKVVPDAKIAWKDVWHGALVTAFLFTGAKYLIGLYLAKVSVGSAYGAAGSLVVLVVWIYYSSQIVLFGAELTQVVARKRGAPTIPTKDAVVFHPARAEQAAIAASSSQKKA